MYEVCLMFLCMLVNKNVLTSGGGVSGPVADMRKSEKIVSNISKRKIWDNTGLLYMVRGSYRFGKAWS